MRAVVWLRVANELIVFEMNRNRMKWGRELIARYNLKELIFFLEKTMSERKIRVLIAKPGLDGHDRGAKVVARALRDAGMEVIYTGLRQTPEMIAEAALQEDVDVVGLSILSGAHNALVPRVVELLRKNGQTDVCVFVGGIVPEEDVPGLLTSGVKAVYGPGSSTQKMAEEIAKFVSDRLEPAESLG